ncbi:Uncharacterized protein TCM_014699 [Theobroma cacao]|uniref:Uncharacterized protein n=1 Tax=Theobroma cacao TaxID=3641 RepID=A0A061G055_THECC|nr:Uncharacterized protein TCM_014699 [Theobroma cacao]
MGHTVSSTAYKYIAVKVGGVVLELAWTTHKDTLVSSKHPTERACGLPLANTLVAAAAAASSPFNQTALGREDHGCDLRAVN